MKIYKVYAQCCRNPKPITEITLDKAQDLIIEAVETMISNEMVDVEVDEDDDTVVNESCAKLMHIALDWFNKEDYFECGDFTIYRTDEYPSRPSSGGYTSYIFD